MSIKVVTSTFGYKIELCINGVKFRTPREFDTKKDALKFLAKHGLREIG